MKLVIATVLLTACVSTDQDPTATTAQAVTASADRDPPRPTFLCMCHWGCFPSREDQTQLGETWTFGDCEWAETNDGEFYASPAIGSLRTTQNEATDYCNTSVYDPLKDTGRTLIALMPDVESCFSLE